jgi:hypothetical protein
MREGDPFLVMVQKHLGQDIMANFQSTFVNEKGNSINMRLEARDDATVRIVVTSPSSTCDNVWTDNEAKQLMGLLMSWSIEQYQKDEIKNFGDDMPPLIEGDSEDIANAWLRYVKQ